MGKKIVIVCVVAVMAIVWSSLVIGVHSSSVLRHKRQSDDGKTTDHPFGDVEIDNERGSPPEDKDTSGSVPAVKPAASVDNNTTSTPAPVVNGNTTLAAEVEKDEGTSTVTVTVVIVILVLAVVLVVGVFIYVRIRRRRMADYDKKTQIQMSSTSNAGVYVDLTSAPSAEKEKQPDSPETEHLNKEDE